MFSTEVLEKIIGFYGSSVQGVAGDFLGQSLRMFHDQQQRFQEQMREAMQSNPMSSALGEMTAATSNSGSRCRQISSARRRNGPEAKTKTTDSSLRQLISAGLHVNLSFSVAARNRAVAATPRL